MATLTLKHGAHRGVLTIAQLAAGSSGFAPFTYDFADTTYSVYDPTTEYAVRGTLVFGANVTGQATNFFSIIIGQYSSAGVLKNQITPFVFNGAGVTATAFVPVDVTSTASSGGSIGNTLLQGWALVPGDTIVLNSANTGTGLANPGVGFSFEYGVPA